MPIIDLNCDLGEGFPHDAELMGLISSANIACGGHAGDDESVRAAVELADRRGVRTGAHPSFADRDGFGRREIEIAWGPLVELIHDQILAFERAAGRRPDYVKPHGALYNMACVRDDYARAVGETAALRRVPAIMGPPGSRLELEAADRGLGFHREGFADRRYRPDGRLVPRDRPDALIEDPAEAVAQAERLIADHGVRSLCVHGDNPRAVEFVRELRRHLEARGFAIAPVEPA
jgi:UPF0271 protein